VGGRGISNADSRRFGLGIGCLKLEHSSYSTVTAFVFKG
jgi:hypothetical protein